MVDGEKRFVFFDLGWTLEDETHAQIARALHAATLLRAYDIMTTANAILNLQEEGASRLVPGVFVYALSHFGLNDVQLGTVARESQWDKTKLCLYPEAIPLLDTLRTSCFLGLIANQTPGTRRRLKEYGILHYFDLIFASDEMEIQKPDPRVFELALERAGCRPEDAWMVGDRLDNDIRPAKQAGWNTIRVMQGYNIFQHPRDAFDQPDFTVDNLAQIVLEMVCVGKKTKEST